MSEQSTVTPGGNYVPPDQRSDVGKATEDRRPEQIRQDNLYQAVMPQEPEHPHDKRIQSLEATVRQKKKDREFSQLKSVEERELFGLKERRAADEREAEHREATDEWVQGVSGELTRLQELKKEFTESEGYTGSQVASVDRAVKQFSTMGADLKVAKRMLAEIEATYEAKLSKDELELEAKILGHQNLIQQLRDKRKKAEPKETDYLTPEDRLFLAAQTEWKAAEEAGNQAEAKRLRDVYWSEKFQRGKV